MAPVLPADINASVFPEASNLKTNGNGGLLFFFKSFGWMFVHAYYLRRMHYAVLVVKERCYL